MKSRIRASIQWKNALLCGGATTLVALLCLGIEPLEWWFERLGFDLLTGLAAETPIKDVVYVQLNEAAFRELHQAPQAWDRKLGSQLLDHLSADHAKLVVFDVFLGDPGPPETDRALAEAIRRNGHVVLGVFYGDLYRQGLIGGEPIYPQEAFKSVAAGLGSVSIARDKVDGVVREMHPGHKNLPTLAWKAAQLVGTALPDDQARLSIGRWLNYPSSLEHLGRISFSDALQQPPGVFSNKTVFVGKGPSVKNIGEANDEYLTPLRLFGGGPQPGGIIHLVTFLNLTHGDWFECLPNWATALLVVSFGLFVGCLFSVVRPWISVVSAAGLATIVFSSASVAMLVGHRWFPWMIPAVVQVPFALVWAHVAHLRRLGRAASSRDAHYRQSAKPPGGTVPLGSSLAERLPISQEPERTVAASNAPNPAPTIIINAPQPAESKPVSAPDHRMIYCIGEGAYGQVWLAQDIIGTYHAVKFVFRSSFVDDKPFNSEFHGIQQFTPISRMHPGLVNILHVGRNDEEGYFFYIMELGDDEKTGQKIDPATYRAKTLGHVIRAEGRQPAAVCVRLGIELSSALDFLHQQHLIHRDIKPANIIYVRDRPKFADVGLVARIDTQRARRTYVGTEGYIAPEGPGTPVADIYSLGKVLYEVATGFDRLKFPDLPSSVIANPDPLSLRLNEIVLKACESNPQDRYQSAKLLHDDLIALQ